MGKKSREKLARKEQGDYIVKEEKPVSLLEKICLKVIEWGTLIALLTPLILARGYFFPYVSPKTLFFRVVVDIIFIAYIALICINKKYKPKMNFLTLSIIIFLIVTTLTSIFGVNLEKSFWSVYERMTGLLTFFHLFAFYVVLTSVFKKREQWEKILTHSISVGIIVTLLVFASAGDPSSRYGGPLGNPSFMAAYLLFNIFFAAILFFSKEGLSKYFYGSSFIFFLLSLLFPPGEDSVGAIMGILGGLVLLAIGYLFFAKREVFNKVALALGVLALLGGLALSQPEFMKEKKDNFWYSGSVQSRLVVWEMGWHAWQERFLFGWGQENFNIPFAKHFDPELPVSGEIWYDRTHNNLLEKGVTSGVVGLLSYLAIYAVAIYYLLKISKNVVEKKNIFLPIGMIAVISAYLAQSLFVFDMISSYMMLFLSLAFIYFLIQKEKPEEDQKDSVFPPILGSLMMVFVLLIFFWGNIQPIRASREMVKGIASPSLNESIIAFQKSLQISPMAVTEMPEQFAKRVVNDLYGGKQPKEDLMRGFEASIEEMKNYIDKNPLDYRGYLFLGKHYNDFYLLTKSTSELERAEYYLNKAFDFSPNNQQTYWNLAQTKMLSGKEDEAINLLKEAVDLKPNYIRSRWYLFSSCRIIQRYDKAFEEFMEIDKLGYNWTNNLEELRQVIEVYQSLGKNEEVIPLYLIAIEKGPNDARLKAGLSAAYSAIGQMENAKKYAAEALKIGTDLNDQIKEFLNQILAQ